MGLISVGYDEGGGGVKEFEEVESNETRGLVSKATVIAVENLIAPTKGSIGRDEKTDTVYNQIPIALDGLYKCQD